MAVCRPHVFRLYKAAFCYPNHLGLCVHSASFKSTLPVFKEKDPPPRNHEQQLIINEPTERKHPAIDLHFSNAEEAYRSKRTSELARALLVFNLCSINFLVDNQKTLLTFGRKVLGKKLFAAVMKQTFYGHFVAGADQVSIKPVITNNMRFGVKSILDYSAEEDITVEKAVKAEMTSCTPENLSPEGVVAEKSVLGDIGDKLQTDKSAQFQAHEEFADRREKVVSARTYFYEGEKQCDHNVEIFIGCIDAVSHATEKSGLAAIKLTALGKPQLLLQMSDVINTVKNFFRLVKRQPAGEYDIGGRRFRVEDYDKQLMDAGVKLYDSGSRKRISVVDISEDGEVDLLDWNNLLEINRSLSKLFFVPDLKTGKLRCLVDELTVEEEEQMKNMLRRVNTLAEYASDKGVRIMVDAEQSYFQPAISRLTMEMMRKFNKERSVIFNTYQCYLKQALNNIVVDLDLARREDFYFGAKLVRGAYMEQERERAQTIGYEDPINPTYEATTVMYYRVMEEVMRQINLRDRDKVAVMIASHNEGSICDAVQLMKKYNIGPQDRLICFGQLLGMCDYVSFPLGQAGYSVYKYVPFGPVEEVLPYLSRRAMENRGIFQKVQKEKDLLKRELWRRFKSGELNYDPTVYVPAPAASRN